MFSPPHPRHKPFKSLREVVGQIIGRSLIDVRQLQLLCEALPQQRRCPPAWKPYTHTRLETLVARMSAAQHDHVHELPNELYVTR